MGEPILKHEDLDEFRYNFEKPTLAGLIYRIRQRMAGRGGTKVEPAAQPAPHTEEEWQKTYKAMTKLGYKFNNENPGWEWGGAGSPPENLPGRMGPFANPEEIREYYARKARVSP